MCYYNDHNDNYALSKFIERKLKMESNNLYCNRVQMDRCRFESSQVYSIGSASLVNSNIYKCVQSVPKLNTVKPRYTAPRFTANPDIPRPFPSPQIGLNIHNVNQTKPRFTADPIYRGFLPAPKTRGKSGFYCILIFSS